MSVAIKGRLPATARKIIEALQAMPPGTVIKTQELARRLNLRMPSVNVVATDARLRPFRTHFSRRGGTWWGNPFALLVAALLVFACRAEDLQLAWAASPTVDSTLSYNVFMSTSATTAFFFYTNTSSLSVTITGLAPATYRFYVTATNLWGESVPSNIVQTPPGRPSAVTITIKKAN